MTLPHSSSYIPYSQRPWALHCSCQQETLRYQYSSGGKTVPRQISDPVSFSERERGKKRNKKKKNEQGPELGLVNHTCTTRHRAHRAAPHYRTHMLPSPSQPWGTSVRLGEEAVGRWPSGSSQVLVGSFAILERLDLGWVEGPWWL